MEPALHTTFDLKISLNKKKKNAFRRFVFLVGDPQTYALLHCSVFKERTLGPDRVDRPTTCNVEDGERTGSRVTTTSIEERSTTVKAHDTAFRSRNAGLATFYNAAANIFVADRCRRRCALARLPQIAMSHQAPDPFLE